MEQKGKIPHITGDIRTDKNFRDVLGRVNSLPSNWNELTGKPSTYPPSSHTHVKADITDFTHTHVKADITDWAHTHPSTEISDWGTYIDQAVKTDSSVQFDKLGLGGYGTSAIRFYVNAYTVTTPGISSNGALFVMPNRAVTANETNYLLAMSTSGSYNYSIASGITDSGYRMGISCSNLCNDTTFQGTLNQAYGMRIQHGILTASAGGTITSAFGLYIDSYHNSGTITNKYAIYQTGNQFNNYFSGRTWIGGAAIGVDANLVVARGTGTQGTAMMRGTDFSTHFNYSSAENTYIRGGKATSEVWINDTSSGKVIIASGGGDVGIGTTSPDTKLHLKGANVELRFEENTAGDCVDMRCNTGGAFVIEQNKDAVDQNIYIRPTMTGQSNTKHLIVGDQGGFLGVGGVPECHVDTVGTIRSTGYQSPSSGIGLEMGYYDTGSYAYAYGVNRTASSAVELRLGGPYTGNQLVLKTDNKVGIGTGAPNEQLSVEGRISLKETTAPSNTANYGKLYVKSSDSRPYFMDDSGNEFGLIAVSALARGYRSGSQTNSATGWQKVQLNAESYDIGSDFDSTTNYRFIAPRTGYYSVSAGMTYSPVTGAVIAAGIWRNGSMATRIGHGTYSAGQVACFNGSDIIYLTASQYLELYYYCSQADGSVLGAGIYDSYLTARFLQP